MNTGKIKLCLAVIASLVFSVSLFAQAKPDSRQNSDPDKARLITTDIENFWKAYDLATDEPLVEKKREIFQREYFDRASPGLRFYAAMKIGKVDSLVATITQRPLYYASIRENSLKVVKLSLTFKKVLQRLKSLYPEAVFPDIYFVIGRMSSAGTASDKALIIGVDMFGKSKDYPSSELTDWHKQVLLPFEKLPAIVAHEIIHFQQAYGFAKQTLLTQAIQEGSADFLGEMIAGQMINSHLHEYGNPREQSLWNEFEMAMQSNDVSNWLYNGTRAKDRPADLGYYIGYKLCEAYYRKARDKQQAVKDILHIKNAEQFLSDSQYTGKFTRK
jgi:hypothetical protein